MRSGLKRCTCGSDQCPAVPEDTVQPGLCLGKWLGAGSVRTMDGPDPVDNLRIFAVPSRSPRCTLWEEALVSMERWQVGS